MHFYWVTVYSAPRRTQHFTKEKEWKIENKNYRNKWVFSCLLNIGKDCDKGSSTILNFVDITSTKQAQQPNQGPNQFWCLQSLFEGIFNTEES